MLEEGIKLYIVTTNRGLNGFKVFIVICTAENVSLSKESLTLLCSENARRDKPK